MVRVALALVSVCSHSTVLRTQAFPRLDLARVVTLPPPLPLPLSTNPGLPRLGRVTLPLPLPLPQPQPLTQAFLVSGVHLDAMIILDAYPSDAVAARYVVRRR